MKKNIQYIGVFICFIITLIVGVYVGSLLEEHTINKANGSLYNTTKVAVVNLDSGVKYQNKDRNFAKEILSKYPQTYTLTGLNDAQAGIDDGRYAAYVIVPSDFSKNIISINESPVKSTITYEISGDLSQQANDKAWQNVMLLKDTLNEDVSYVYVSAVLNEFHNGQENASKVLSNDATDKKVLSEISNVDLIATIKFTKVDRLPNDEKAIDIATSIEKNKDIMNGVDTTYKGYLGETANELATLKNDNSSLHSYLNKDVLDSFQAIPRLQKEDGLSIFDYQKHLMPYVQTYNDSVMSTKNEIADNLKSDIDADNQSKIVKHQQITTDLDDFVHTYRDSYRDNITNYKNAINAQINTTLSNAQFPNTKQYINKQDATITNLNDEIQQHDGEIQQLTFTINSLKGEVKDATDKYTNMQKENEENTKKYKISKYLNGVIYNDLHNRQNPIQFENGDALIDQVISSIRSSSDYDKVQKYVKEYAKLMGKTGTDVDTYGIKDFLKDSGQYTDDVNSGKEPEPTFVSDENKVDISSYMKPITAGVTSDDSTVKLAANEKAKVNSGKMDTLSPDAQKALTQDVSDLQKDLREGINKINNQQPQDPYDSSLVSGKLTTLTGRLDTIEGAINTTSTEEAIRKIPTIDKDTVHDAIEKDIKPSLDAQMHAFDVSATTLNNQIANSNHFLGQLSEYDPLSKIKPNVIERYVNTFMSNNAQMQSAIQKQDSGYLSFVDKSYNDADKHIQTLQDDVSKYQELSDKQLSKGLENAKTVKNNTSAANASLMNSYISKLPFTKNGTVANNKVYDFITSPTIMEGDKATTKNQTKNTHLSIILISVGSICVLALLILVIHYRYRFVRTKKM